MANSVHVHQLTGCSPVPLASYLKALGILRLVSEQVDATAQGWWSGEVFHLRTILDQEALCNFFLEDYAPTPLIGPWGARSGFYMDQSEASSRTALNAIADSSLNRLALFKSTIESMRETLRNHGFDKKPSEGDDQGKWRLKLLCRSSLPDEALPWVDAAFVLMDSTPKYPPILGTGGNEGSGSYMSGFSQQIVAVTLHRLFDHALPTSLFGGAFDRNFVRQTPGHFMPISTGGPNASSDSEGETVMNPWDYILLLEGVVVFAGACVKRLESHSDHSLAFPFTVTLSGVGFGSAATNDEVTSRGETWVPLWSRPTRYNELSATFAEGRSAAAGRKAKSAIDFSRSIATLGIDRGISAFQRYGFMTRNGDRSTFAVSLGQSSAKEQPQVKLIDEIDSWLNSFRGAVLSKNAPSRARRALHRLESTILELCREYSHTALQDVLIALGEAESTLFHCSAWRTEERQRPIPLLSASWLTECDDKSDEFRLATSLAAMFSKGIGDFRQYVESVQVKKRHDAHPVRRVEWNDDSTTTSQIVWDSRGLDDILISVLQRRMVEALRNGERTSENIPIFPGHSLLPASSENVNSFLRSRTDDSRINSLVRGLILLDWEMVRHDRIPEKFGHLPSHTIPDGTFALLKLCHTSWPVRDIHVRIEPSLVRICRSADASRSLLLAARRLMGSGLPTVIKASSHNSTSLKRTAAALLFPLSLTDTQRLADCVLVPPKRADIT